MTQGDAAADRIVDTLREGLREEGYDVTRTGSGEGLVLRSGPAVPAGRHIVVRASATSLADYLADLSDARDVFPDVPDDEARYRLFLVHLDEELWTRPPAAQQLTMDGAGMRWR